MSLARAIGDNPPRLCRGVAVDMAHHQVDILLRVIVKGRSFSDIFSGYTHGSSHNAVFAQEHIGSQ